MRKLINYFHPLEKQKRYKNNYLARQTTLSSLQKELINSLNPELSTPVSELDYIVLDFETTGLNSKKDVILSLGWVDINKGKVDLNTAKHLYLNDDSLIKPKTAVINHITPQILQKEGVSIDYAMATFMKAALGKVIIAHCCGVEKNFFNHYMKTRYNLTDFPLFWLDTLCIERKIEQAVNKGQNIDLTLASTRERYGLPEYNAHNALADAVATAELFLAQQKRLASGKELYFGTVFRMSY